MKSAAGDEQNSEILGGPVQGCGADGRWERPNLGHTHEHFEHPPTNTTQHSTTTTTGVYHLRGNYYSFDALQAYCFGINIKV